MVINGSNCAKKLGRIGHDQKTVETRLRKQKSKTRGLPGKGKLTDNFIDRIQNHYRIAICSNVGNIRAVQENRIAALFY